MAYWSCLPKAKRATVPEISKERGDVRRKVEDAIESKEMRKEHKEVWDE